MMRFATAGAFLVLVLLGAPVLQASEAMKAILDSYLQIYVQLANDKVDGVKDAATAIVTKAKTMGATGVPIVKTATAVSAAADLQAARQAFAELSEAVIAGAKADGQELGDIKVAFCPMIKKPWLQKDDKIKNPYYGTMMSTCGEFKK